MILLPGIRLRRRSVLSQSRMIRDCEPCAELLVSSVIFRPTFKTEFIMLSAVFRLIFKNSFSYRYFFFASLTVS